MTKLQAAKRRLAFAKSLLSGGPQEMSGGPPGQASTLLSEAASEALLAVAALIHPEHVGDTVLRAVLCLAHDNEIEESRVVATQVLGSLAPVLGAELCQQYVLPELICLADDPAFRVRKAAALRVGAARQAVGGDGTPLGEEGGDDAVAKETQLAHDARAAVRPRWWRR